MIHDDVSVSCSNNAPYGMNYTVLHRDNAKRM